MPALGSTAHHRARGERTPLASMDDPIEHRSYALWRAIRTGAVRTKGVQAYGPPERGLGDVRGYEVEVNVTVKARDIWPELSALSKEAQEVYVGEIRSFLRGSGNAVCLTRPMPGEHGRQPKWWIRDEWQKSTAVPIFRTLEPTTRERRLTPAEAGEDRQPGPVSVRRAEESDVPTEVMQALAARVFAFLRQASEPAYQADVVYGLRANTVDVGKALRALVKTGKVFRREETPAERPQEANGRMRYLYWIESPIPPRLTPLAPGKTQAMDFVAQLAPGEELRITWMYPADKDEIAEMVEAGLLEYTRGGEYVRQLDNAKPNATAVTEETTPPTPEEPVPPTPRTPPPPPRKAAPPGDLGAALVSVVEQHLDRLVGERIEAALAAEREARQKVETELAELKVVADKRAKALRAMLGDDI